MIVTTKNNTMNPEISVVTSVYNGAAYLRRSLDSVLEQQNVDFEVIVIDDGSTDETPRILETAALQDRRIRVLRQKNRGLTRALIRGCAEARGKFIARHDLDDLSLPGRLAAEVKMLKADDRLSMVSCRSRLVGPDEELLFETEVDSNPVRATQSLIGGLNGPCHGSVMFRADAYHRAGGYRAEYRFAQDWDLWLRLSEIGLIGFVPKVLYALRINENSISTHRRKQQQALADLAHRCREMRQSRQSEETLLAEAARISQDASVARKWNVAANSYFIGKCLLDRSDKRAVRYLRHSVRSCPWHWRSWAALLAATIDCHPTAHPASLTRESTRT